MHRPVAHHRLLFAGFHSLGAQARGAFTFPVIILVKVRVRFRVPRLVLSCARAAQSSLHACWASPATPCIEADALLFRPLIYSAPPCTGLGAAGGQRVARRRPHQPRDRRVHRRTGGCLPAGTRDAAWPVSSGRCGCQRGRSQRSRRGRGGGQPGRAAVPSWTGVRFLVARPLHVLVQLWTPPDRLLRRLKARQ